MKDAEINEGEVIFALVEERELDEIALDLELSLQEVAGYMAGHLLKQLASLERVAVRRKPFKHRWWERRLYGRVRKPVLVVAPKGQKTNVLRSLYVDWGQWDRRETK